MPNDKCQMPDSEPEPSRQPRGSLLTFSFPFLPFCLLPFALCLLPSSLFAAVPIHRAAKPVAIDGVLDEPCWRQATPVRADYANSKQGALGEQPHLLVRYAWDERYLYIAYETFDRNLVTMSTGKKEGPPDNLREGCEIWHPEKKIDVVEFFISFGSTRFFWEIHHNASNHFNDIWITVPDPAWPVSKSAMVTHGILFGVPMYVEDDEGFKLATAVRLKPKAEGKPSTVNEESDRDTGYTAELRLPWQGIGAPAARHTWIVHEPKEPGGQKTTESGPWKMEGQEVMILAAVQDGDLAERYHHSSPTRKGGWFHTSAADWPRYRLAP